MENTINLKEEIIRLQKLVDIVYQKIQALDFPDISRYSKDFKGVIAFEDDLLKIQNNLSQLSKKIPIELYSHGCIAEIHN